MNEVALTEYGTTTNVLADRLGVKPESIRVHLCRRGSYYGIIPRRLPNGRLLWPADTMDRLLEQGRA